MMAQNKSKRARIGLLACALLAPTAQAAETAPVPATEKLRLEAAAKELTQLERDEASQAGNPEFDYRLGQALYQGGRAGEALFAFERVLMSAPGNVDARLKIAQIHLERGAAAAAREILAPLSGRTLDATQQKQLDGLRAGTDAASSGGGISVRGYVLGGAGRDSNVTGGPNRASILLPGTGTATAPATPTVLGTAAQESDRVSVIEAGVALRKAINDDTWLTAGSSVRRGFNATRRDVQDGYINLDLGLIRRMGGDYYGLAFLAQDYRVAGINYRNSRGFRIHWNHPLSERTVLSTYVQQMDFDFPANAIDNSGRTTFGVTGESALDGGKTVTRYGLYAGDDRAKDATKPHFSYRLAGLQLGATQRVTEDLSISVATGLEQHNHQSEDKLHLLLRRDSQRSLGISADYRLAPSWHLIPQYTYTNNSSTTGLYAYTRGIFLLQLKWDFDNEKN